MSYILDALKKSEQERQQKKTPNIQTIQRPQFNQQNNNSIAKYTILTLAFLLVLMTVFYFLLLDFFHVSTKDNVVLSVSDSEGGKAAESVSSVVKVPSVAEKSPSANNALPIAPPLLMEFWELPDPVQKEIPPMTFSFHVYSESAERRTIIINNRRVKEGGVVAVGLVLEEVTPEGVILNWQDQYRFTMSVVAGW
jgi:general secretion pathway protein B